MSGSRQWVACLFILALLQTIGIGLFSIGFFPYKVYLNGFATKQDASSSFLASHLHKNHWQQPTFDRLVFVVVDALRNDFVLGEHSGFGFVKSQIENGNAMPFTARATAPTVTMPRIKALTTGTIPSFLDAILNIAESDTSSSLQFYDNWVYQLKNSRNNTLNFFGDDTWIRLFPGLFDKMDGTTSFYVSDTIQVDLNVTRHIEKDMKENDWDVTILHYLGLDHIGHLSGPDSPLMIPKQKEMDEAISLIHEIVTKQDIERLSQDPESKGTLIVLCGDHGMNKNGNHGGSSIEETSAALVFFSPKFQSRSQLNRGNSDQEMVMGYPVIDQIDLVPTLASLLSFPIPKNSLGKIIIDLMKTDDYTSILQALHLNAYQLSHLLEKTSPSIRKYIRDPLSFVHDDSSIHGRLFAYAASLHEQYLSNDIEDLAIESIEAYQKLKAYSIGLCFLQMFFFRLAIDWNNSVFSILVQYGFSKWDLAALTLGVTSFLAVFQALKYGKKQAIDVDGTAYIIQKIIRSEAAGIQGDGTFPKKYSLLLSIDLVKQLDQVKLGKLIYNYGLSSLLVLLGLRYIAKRAELLNIDEPANSESDHSRFLKLLLYTVTPLLILLSSTQNTGLFMLFYLQYQAFDSWLKIISTHCQVPSWLLGMFVLCLCHASFFITAHSNSIASIDLSQAYVGIEGYNTVLIGVLSFVSNWSGSIWWSVASWSLLIDAKESKKRWVSFLVTQSTFFSLAISSLSVAVSILREHLFIWTVFSPKYLYQVTWNLVFHWIFQVFVGTVFVLGSQQKNESSLKEAQDIIFSDFSD
ncbi:alkaline-phosphatase-like protein [Sporodiniella umbellata]|nr:alkaline-phosphatase-like protein [Sporodiniella umbellata]